MNLSGKDPAWIFPEMCHVPFQSTCNKVKSSALTSAEVIPSIAKVDQNLQIEAFGIREITPTKYQGETEGIVIKTDIVISLFNSRKALLRSYHFYQINLRGKRCRIDVDEGFDLHTNTISKGSNNSYVNCGTTRYTIPDYVMLNESKMVYTSVTVTLGI
ncbi:unnamed protein product [Mytilus edulis]|uniref:Uncharacterized protein n=1 Tax=Mytilus edulis TaxID=6550 RepID=A0A8S3QSR7_MYTED|nr:unnamed protein product [Mytilus edulis]